MNLIHIAGLASGALGTVVRFVRDRRYSDCVLAEDVGTLTIGLPDRDDLGLELIDADPSRRGVILELSIPGVCHEPSFGLLLPSERRVRHAVVVGSDGRCRLRPADGIATVAEIVSVERGGAPEGHSG